MAVPRKFLQQCKQSILTAIRAGNYVETAVAFAGISKSTFYAWLKAGARSKSGPYHEFSDAVKRALAEAEVNDVELIAKAATRNWQAAAWRLERKFPKRWGRGERPPEEPLPNAESERAPNLDRLSVEELRVFTSILSKLEGHVDEADPSTPPADEEPTPS